MCVWHLWRCEQAGAVSWSTFILTGLKAGAVSGSDPKAPPGDDIST